MKAITQYINEGMVDMLMKVFVGKIKMLQKKFNISENSIDELSKTLAENQDSLNNELSDLDDNECEEYIENKERYCVKKELWKEKNKEWLSEQEDKKKVNEKDFIEKKRYIKLNEIGYRTPKEAIMHNERFLKMRMKNKGTFIKELFDDPGLVSEINVYKHKTNII
jgi:hypothetical protein